MPLPTQAMDTRFSYLRDRMSQINEIFTSHIFNQSFPSRYSRSVFNVASDIALQSIPDLSDSSSGSTPSDYSLNPFSYAGRLAS